MKLQILPVLFQTALAIYDPERPIVDLGYSRHLGTFNSTTRYTTYHNIRFAAPPLGERRFRPPQPPFYEAGVQVGNINDYVTACHQYFAPSVIPGGESDLEFGSEDCLVRNYQAIIFVTFLSQEPYIIIFSSSWMCSSLKE
jgi:hypothetical protein